MSGSSSTGDNSAASGGNGTGGYVAIYF
jgi:hypothetical protein